MRKNRNYWTKKICFEEALKYETRKEFSKKSCTAYEKLRKNEWLNAACDHMKKPYEAKFVWTFKKCQLLALKYRFRKDFQNEHKNAYYSAMYNGWLNEICVHMQYQKLPNGYWHDINNCKNEALKYITKTEFVRGSQHVYYIALKNGWLNNICQHMTPIGDRYNKCIYSYEFPDNHVYVGLTHNINVRQKNRDRDLTDSVTKYINETKLIPVRKQLTEYVPVDVAIKLEEEFLQKYLNDGWIGLNKAKTGGIGGRKRLCVTK